MNKYKKITLDGLIFNNPTFMLVLGTCPTLGLMSSASSALYMGLTVVVILTLSNILISALRKLIPNEVRIPAYIVIIATLVTFVRMFLEKLIPAMYDALGGFLALIVVNCIILGRAEAFANKHTVAESAVDGLANGFGFTIAITIMGIICEFLGSGSFFGLEIMNFQISMFSQPAGAFIVYGLCICAFTAIIDTFTTKRTAAKNAAKRELLAKDLLEQFNVNTEEPLAQPAKASGEV
ncbi:MAG: electron transport complex subunit RsxE [Clostridia bacterium]|nr:electron transport complex subunit RsxE [Clostridia bacterium]